MPRNNVPFIELRSSTVGRQAYLKGSTLAIWEVVWIAKGYGNNVERTAAHFEVSPFKVRAALNYAKAFPEEIDAALRMHEASDFDSLSRMVPEAKVFPPPHAT